MRNIQYLVFVLSGFFALFAHPVQGQKLTDAARKNDSVQLEALISQGVDINEVDEQGNTSLMLAARWGNASIVRILLEHGAKPDGVRSAKGRTALMIGCAYYSGLNICKMLVEKGAGVNLSSNDGTTPLMLAAQFGKVEVVTYLLAHGANVSVKNSADKTALVYARSADLSIFGSAGIPGVKLDKEGTIQALEKATK